MQEVTPLWNGSVERSAIAMIHSEYNFSILGRRIICWQQGFTKLLFKVKTKCWHTGLTLYLFVCWSIVVFGRMVLAYGDWWNGILFTIMVPIFHIFVVSVQTQDFQLNNCDRCLSVYVKKIYERYTFHAQLFLTLVSTLFVFSFGMIN